MISVVRTLGQRQVWGGSLVVLVAAILANFTSASARYMISPVVPLITTEFGISNSVMGLALTGMWAMFALAQFPSGVLSDRFGERRIILLALVLIGSGSLLVVIAPTFSAFAVFVLIIGLGAGFYIVAGTAFLTRRYEKTGGVLGAHVTGPALAGFFTPPIVVFLAVQFGWRVGMLYGVALALLIVGLWLWQTQPTKPVRPEAHVGDQFTRSELLPLLTNRGLLFTTLLAILSFFVFTTVASFFPTFLVEHSGYSVEMAGVAFAGMFFLRAICNPVFGRLSDSIGRDPVILGCVTLASTGFVVLVFHDSLALLLLGIALVGSGIAYGGVITSRFMDTLTPEERGRGYGLGNSAGNLFGASGSFVTGTLAVIYGWGVAILVLVVFLLGVFTLLLGNFVHARLTGATHRIQ